MCLNKNDVYRELHEQARSEDFSINSRFAIFFTANAFVFSGFISFIFNENWTINNINPISFILIIVPFMFLQFSNYFYFNYILPAQVSLKYIWEKIKLLEEEEDKLNVVSTARLRTNCFKTHRTISRFPYTNFTRIVSICWLVIIIICVDKLTKYILLNIKEQFNHLIYIIISITIFYLTTELIILISKYVHLKKNQNFIYVIFPKMYAYILSISTLTFSYYLLNLLKNHYNFIENKYIYLYIYFLTSIYFMCRLINFVYEIFFKIIAYFDYLKSGKNEYISSILHHGYFCTNRQKCILAFQK